MKLRKWVKLKMTNGVRLLEDTTLVSNCCGEEILNVHDLNYICTKCHHRCKGVKNVKEHTIYNQNKEETKKNFEKVIEGKAKSTLKSKAEDFDLK